jgi:fluoroacetyl-CoA thioesterase
MSSFENVQVGLGAERFTIVDESLAAMHTKTPVLATPFMIQLMEGVCKDLVQELLPPGFITVGYEVHIKHKAAAALGTQVKTGCKLIEVDGRKLLFEVRVTVEDKVIGEGQHRRTIIRIITNH